MTVAHDAIAAELATLTRTVEQPVAPFGYGSDLSCERDLTDDMAEVDPFALLGLGQACVRRLDTPRGALADDPDYGLDLKAEVNRGATTDHVLGLAGRIRSELEKDDRVARASVVVTPSSDGSSLTIEPTITPADPALVPFTLTLAVTSAAVLLEAIRGGTR